MTKILIAILFLLPIFNGCTSKKTKVDYHSPVTNEVDCNISTPNWLKSRDRELYKCPTLPATKEQLTLEWTKLLIIMGISLAVGIPIFIF